MIRKQRGFLALAAVALIVIVGFLGVAISYMFTSSVTSTLNYTQASKAFYIAEGGLEEATRYLLTPNLSGSAARIACGSLSGNSNLTNSSLGSGTFTVTASGPFYVSSPTTLSSALTSSATTISVASTTNYKSSGRIMIDQELINYASTTSTSFVGVTRGVDGSTAAAHVSGAKVGQYQCILTSNGGVPNLTSPINKRVVTDNIQLQEAWVVGNSQTGKLTFIRWNNPTEVNWSNASLTATAFNLKSVSMASYVDGWAVGVSTNFYRWNGSSWSSVATGMSTTTWNGVYCVSANECVAVGNNSGNNPGLASWNGTSWSQTTPSGTSAKTVVSAVNCDSASDCWAVGSSAGSGVFYNWNGSSWTGTSVSGLASGDFPFNGVFCNSSTDCWAVGTASANFARKNGASWTDFATGLVAGTYNSIFCNTTSDCWAVGNTNGGNDLIVHWNGTAWSRDTSNPTPAVNLLGVSCTGPSDCWAVGSTASGGFVHYNGTSWSTFTTSGLPATTVLNSISINGPSSQPQSAWSETFS